MLVIFVSSFLLTTSLFANPVLNNVPAGKVSIQQTPNSTVINQSSQKAIINWRSFNIGKQQSTVFQQPAHGITLNRINPQSGVSEIFGSLLANGRIILINPAGIYFAPGAFVNVGGLIASTADLSNRDFLHDNYQFHAVPGYDGSIINQGKIIAADHGLVALIGNGVENDGLIKANLGQVVLASGSAFTMNFAGNDLINFAITKPTTQAGLDENGHRLKNGVSNTGKIISNGGQVLVTAMAAQGVLDNVINMQGVVEARSVGSKNSEIILSGDPSEGQVYVRAKIDASGKKPGQTGGTVEITGHDIFLDSPTVIDVSGAAGGGNIFVGGNAHGAGPLPNATATVVAPGARLIADAISNGNGGNIIIWSNDVTKVFGSLSAQGGTVSGNGGYIETSGGYLDINGASVNTLAPHGTRGMWLLDPTDVIISTSADNNATFSGGIYQVTNGALATSNINVNNLINDLMTTDITVSTTPIAGSGGGGSGNITVAAPITWTAATTLTLSAANDIFINAAITALNGGLSLNAANTAASITTSAAGAINVKNFTITQGQWSQVSNPLPAFNATTFSLTSGVTFLRALSGNGTGANPFLITDVFGLQGMAFNNPNFDYALNNNIDATGTVNWNGGAGFIPIGNVVTNFAGSLNGNNFSINGLTIDTPASGNVGLFGVINNNASVIQNLALSNVNITGSTQVGGLVGLIEGGTVQNVSVSGTVTGNGVTLSQGLTGGLIGFMNGAGVTVSHDSNSATVIENGVDVNTVAVGGLVGAGASGLITNSSNTGSVISNASGSSVSVGGLAGNIATDINNSFSTGNVLGKGNNIGETTAGGLVGELAGSTITNSFSTGNVKVMTGAATAGGFVGNSTSGTVNTSYSTGSVSSTGTDGTGGFMGSNSGNINNSYSLGPVTASANVGGFIGENLGPSGIITNSYSIGAVSGTSNTGGFAGTNSGTVTNSFYDSQASGQGAVSAAGTPETTSAMMTQATFTGFNFGTTWSIIAGQSYPFLLAFYPTAPRAFYLTSSSIPAGTTADLAVNGSIIDTAFAGANHNFYFLEGNNVIGTNNSIADGADVLGFVSSGGTLGNVVFQAPAGGASLSGASALTLTANTLAIGSSLASNMSNTDLATAIGSLSNADILYTASGNNITLGNGSNPNVDLTTSASTDFTVNGNISPTAGGSGNLTFNGLTTLNHTNITSNGTQTYNAAVTLSGPANLSSGNHAIIFNSTINGANNLSLNSASGSTLNGNVNIANLTLGGGGSDVINAASVVTSGTQTYNDALQLGNTSLNASNIIFNGTVTDAQTLNLAITTLNLQGTLALNNLNVTGSGANNSLLVATNNAQTWNITGTNSGNITGAAGVAGSFNFSNIQNLSGGTHGNTFVFSNNASIGGTINGGGTSSTNTISYLAYNTPVTVKLTPGIFQGQTFNSANTMIGNFVNINNLIGNGTSFLTLPNKTNSVTITGPLKGIVNDPLTFSGFETISSTSGSDILHFNLPASINPTLHSAFVGGITMFFINFNLGDTVTVITPNGTFQGVSQIIQQPDSDNGVGVYEMNGDVDQNINAILNALITDYNNYLNKVRINPYCGSSL